MKAAATKKPATPPIKAKSALAPKVKAALKPAVKTAAKQAAITVTKPAANAAVVKVKVPAVAKKLTDSTSKPVPKAGLSADSKINSKAPAKPAVAETRPMASRAPVVPAKQAAKPVKTATSVKPIVQTKPAPAAVGKKPAAPALVPAPKPAPILVERSTSMTSPPALKPGRRSSARAPSQLPPPAPMVPTHAPDAAKASYSTMTERVIAPPPHVAAKKDPKLANNWKTTAGEALTDDEVKAMPDSEYMNDKQMAFFRQKLSVLKQEIHNSAGETTEHLREDTVVVPDPADRATIEEEHALELRTRDRERKLLKKIEQSIARIDSGDYGYCDETGEPIGVGRLIARPTANLSLEAQQRRELKQKMFGD